MKKEYWIFNDELKIKMKVKTDNINHYTSNILSSYFTLNRRPALINRIFIIGLANNSINLSVKDKFKDYLHIDPLEKRLGRKMRNLRAKTANDIAKAGAGNVNKVSGFNTLHESDKPWVQCFQILLKVDTNDLGHLRCS